MNRALHDLMRYKPEVQKKFLPELKKLFESKNKEIQRKLLIFVSTIEWADLDDRVKAFADSKDPQVKIAFLEAVAGRKLSKLSAGIIESVKEAKYDEESSLLRHQIRTLGMLKKLEVQEHLLQKFEDANTTMLNRRLILQYFGNSETTNVKVHNYLKNLCESNETSVEIKPSAITNAAKLKVKGIADVLKKQLDELEKEDAATVVRRGDERTALIEALVVLKHKDIKDLVLELSRDDDYRNRLRAVRYLATMGDAKSKEILEYQYKFDPVPEVKIAAAKALKSDTAKNSNKKIKKKPLAKKKVKSKAVVGQSSTAKTRPKKPGEKTPKKTEKKSESNSKRKSKKSEKTNSNKKKKKPTAKSKSTVTKK